MCAREAAEEHTRKGAQGMAGTESKRVLTVFTLRRLRNASCSWISKY